MRAIDSIAKRHQGLRRPITVPEWAGPDGEPLTLYFGPLTTADMDDVAARLRKDDGIDAEHPAREHDRRLGLLIMKAEDEDGNRVFEWGDMIQLREKAEWHVLQRILAFMYGSALPGKNAEERAEAAKN